MAIHLSLGGIGIIGNWTVYYHNTGEQVYNSGQKIAAEVHTYNGADIISSINRITSNMEGILRSVARGYPKDAMGKEIDLRTQTNELDLLINTIQITETAIRVFLASDAGKVKCNIGSVQMEGIAKIAGRCTSLTAIVARVQEAHVGIRTKIDAENVKTVTPALEDYLPKQIIGIISQYMD
jgi:hypothetical protein